MEIFVACTVEVQVSRDDERYLLDCVNALCMYVSIDESMKDVDKKLELRKFN